MNLSPGAVPPLEDTSEDHSDDVDSGYDSTTYRDSEKGEQDDSETKQREDISGRESVGVSRWRRMVIVMLLLTAVLVITTTYLFLSREETDEFEKSVSI
jgi:hypothetical protein